MDKIDDAIITPSRPKQVAMYHNRRAHKANAVVSNVLTAWSSGLVISAAGYYVQSYGVPFISLGSGTTGATAPSPSDPVVDQYDGAVHWQQVSPRVFLTNPSPLTPA